MRIKKKKKNPSLRSLKTGWAISNSFRESFAVTTKSYSEYFILYQTSVTF